MMFKTYLLMKQVCYQVLLPLLPMVSITTTLMKESKLLQHFTIVEKSKELQQVEVSNGGCNELTAMRDSLIKQGVPDSLISLDYQGRRTLHSITKVKDLGSITIISQKYHNERAIYLAEHYGLQAVAYNATMPNITKKKIQNISREFLARVKLFIDLMSSE